MPISKVIQDVKGRLVASHGEFNWKDVLDRVPHATRRLAIATYSLPTSGEGAHNPLNIVRQASHISTIELVSSVPYRTNVELYESLVDPKEFATQTKIYFHYDNHAKIIIVDDVAYVGSANLSLGTKKSFECGLIIEDGATTELIYGQFFAMIRDSSIPFIGSRTDRIAALFKGLVGQIEMGIKAHEKRLTIAARMKQIGRYVETYGRAQASASSKAAKDFLDELEGTINIASGRLTDAVSEYEELAEWDVDDVTMKILNELLENKSVGDDTDVLADEARSRELDASDEHNRKLDRQWEIVQDAWQKLVTLLEPVMSPLRADNRF